MTEDSEKRSKIGASGELLLIGALSLAVGAGFVSGINRIVHEKSEQVAGATRLLCPNGFYDFDPSTGRLTVRDAKTNAELQADLALSVNGEIRTLSLKKSEVSMADRHTFEAHFRLPLSPGSPPAHAILRLHTSTDEENAVDVLTATLSTSRNDAALERIGLRLLAPARAIFVAGAGEVADVGSTAGRLAVLNMGARRLGVLSARGMVDITTSAEPDRSLRASIGSPLAEINRVGQTADLIITAGIHAPLWASMYRAMGQEVFDVHGVVTGTTERALVWGLDNEGLPMVRTRSDANGHFDVKVPKSVTQWYASLDPSRASPAVHFVPGTTYDLRLDVSPGGELAVQVHDGDGGAPLTTRLIVHGVDGTLDPSFGPDYRASGAGPLIDALHGDVVTPLPAGRYRVAAEHGIEWSIDAQTVDILPGHQTKVALVLRHVVPTPNTISCDLHVHARPSFDSPVAQEDRVLSLVAAGIDFAVPTEHNITGDYAPSIETLGVRNQIASVPGVEVTTFSPSFGHFGVFPYPVGKTIPYRGTNVSSVFDVVHQGDPHRVLVVHHPRLQKGLGYFSIVGFDPQGGPDGKPRVPAGMRTDFDALEVYNGYEAGDSARVEAVLRDYFGLLQMDRGHYAATGSSDSHRIQYNWAGFPRTLVEVPPTSDGSFDTDTVVAAIKHGRMTVTSGPVIDFRVNNSMPGETAIVANDTVHAHLRVTAAPWIDVSSIEIVAGGKSILNVAIPSRPLVLGPEAGTLAEAQARAIRYDADITLTLAPDASWILAIARGPRKMDDILPFMPISPLGFTNPIYLERGP